MIVILAPVDWAEGTSGERDQNGRGHLEYVSVEYRLGGEDQIKKAYDGSQEEDKG